LKLTTFEFKVIHPVSPPPAALISRNSIVAFARGTPKKAITPAITKSVFIKFFSSATEILAQAYVRAPYTLQVSVQIIVQQ
jgi:hypothetical protein